MNYPGTLAAMAILLSSGAATAQDDDAFVTFKVLKPEVALQLAEYAAAAVDAGKGGGGLSRAAAL